MKYFVTIAIFALIAGAFAAQPQLTDEQKAKIKHHTEECKKELPISEEEITKLRNKDLSKPTEAQKCFIRCFFEKADTIKGDEIQEDVIMAKLAPLIGEEKTKELMAKCNGLKGVDSCDTAFKVYECYENGNAGIVM